MPASTPRLIVAGVLALRVVAAAGRLAVRTWAALATFERPNGIALAEDVLETHVGAYDHVR